MAPRRVTGPAVMPGSARLYRALGGVVLYSDRMNCQPNGVVDAKTIRTDRPLGALPPLETHPQARCMDLQGTNSDRHRGDGIAEVTSRISRTTRARLISEPGNPNSPSHSAIRVEIGSGSTAQEVGYLPEWAAAESTAKIRANANQALDSVTNALIYGDVDDPRGLGIWLAGPDNPAVTKEFAPTDLKDLGSKSIAVIIPGELAAAAEPISSDLLLRLWPDPDPGIGVYYPDGRYLGELSDAQALSLRPRLEPLGTWFSIRGTSTVEAGALKVRVRVPKVGDLKKATANTN